MQTVVQTPPRTLMLSNMQLGMYEMQTQEYCKGTDANTKFNSLVAGLIATESLQPNKAYVNVVVNFYCTSVTHCCCSCTILVYQGA